MDIGTICMTTDRFIEELEFVRNKLLRDLDKKFRNKIWSIDLSKHSITDWDNHTLDIYTAIRKDRKHSMTLPVFLADLGQYMFDKYALSKDRLEEGKDSDGYLAIIYKDITPEEISNWYGLLRLYG